MNEKRREAPSGELCGSARLQKPIETELPGTTGFSLEIFPVTVTDLFEHTNHPSVLLFRERWPKKRTN